MLATYIPYSSFVELPFHRNSLLSFITMHLAVLIPRFEKVGGILVCICPSFHPSLPSVRPLLLVKFFIKDFSTTMQARMLIFDTQADDGLLYRGFENPAAFSSLFFPAFVHFSFLPYFEEWNFFVKDFSATMEARMLIFGMQVDDDLMYGRIENQLLRLILPCICPLFFPSILWRMKFFVKDFSTTMQARMLIFGMQVDDNLLYCLIENQPLLSYLSLYLSSFLSFHTLIWWNFSSKISPQPCKLECSYLIHRLMTTCYIVELRTSLLQLILPCICPNFFPSILWRMKFFVKDFSTTMLARMLIFRTQVDDDMFVLFIRPYICGPFSVKTGLNDIT